jgi:hypothetical protein
MSIDPAGDSGMVGCLAEDRVLPSFVMKITTCSSHHHMIS